MGQQRFAGGHAVRGTACPDARRDLHRMQAVLFGNVDRFATLEHGKVNGIERGIAQFDHEWTGDRQQVELARGDVAETTQAGSDGVPGGGRVLSDVAAPRER